MFNHNNLIIGMGPVGLYLAIRLLEEGKKVTILETRYYNYTRNQILGLIPENYIKIKKYFDNLNIDNNIFGKIRLPRTDFDGYICKDLNEVNNLVYSFTLSVLENKLEQYLSNTYGNNKLYTDYRPKNENDKYEVIYEGNIIILRISQELLVPGEDTDFSIITKEYTPEFPIGSFDNVFICTGGTENFELANEIRNMYPHSVPDLKKNIVKIKDIENIKTDDKKESNIPLVGNGFITFIHSKNVNAVKYLLQLKEKCDFSDIVLYQNKFRFFISPYILKYKIQGDNVVDDKGKSPDDKDFNKIFIYLGMQNGIDETNIIKDDKNLEKKLIDEYVLIAQKYYNIELNDTDFEKKINYNGFPIKLSYFTNCIKEYDNDKKTKVCVVGDSASRVNFFSYSGFNYGMANVDAVMNSMLDPETNTYNNPIDNNKILIILIY